MLNVFDIFKVLIGIVIFVLLITLFLRFSGSYSELGETGQQYDAVNAFDALLQSTYTSGNPGEFDGFGKMEYVTFDPPGEPRPFDNARIMFPAGQKTLSVPAFVMTGEGAMAAARTCDDYGWFSFCYVISMPMGDTVLFSPVAGSEQEEKIIMGVVGSLPPDVTVGYCDGDGYIIPSRKDFIGFVGDREIVRACTEEIPEGYWLVSFTLDSPKERTVIVSGGTVMDYSGDQNVIFKDSDVAIALCGPGSLGNKMAMLEKQLAVAADVMHERTILVRDDMLQLNVEPCRGCPTLYPKACGYVEYADDGDGLKHQSTRYLDFVTSLSALENTLGSEHTHEDVIDSLATTSVNYKALEDGGCE
ncbi:MAG: hypothetical protein V1813_00195 [Candidatus Aenigmatarchaeota archaeon]